jgi:hypothetical protein
MDSDQAGNHEWVPVGKPEPGEPSFGVCWCHGTVFVQRSAEPAEPLALAGVGASDA